MAGPKTDVDMETTDPHELVQLGVRTYLRGDYLPASVILSKVLKTLVEEVYGGNEMHEELAQVYLYYGKSLLQVSKLRSLELGDAFQQKDKVEDSDSETEDKTETPEEKAEASEDSKEKDDETADEKSENPDKEVEPSGSGEDPDDKEEEEEPPADLQLAWEVLEVAKALYEKTGEKGEKELAETLITLADVSMENQNMDLCVKDMKEAIAIYKRLHWEDNRIFAESTYKLGLAYAMNNEFSEAIENFRLSVGSLQRRISALEKLEEKKAGDVEEIEDMKGLIPEIEAKISEMETYKEETMKEIMAAVAEVFPTLSGGASTSAPTNSTPAKPASDISHLVKRKRKLDEIAEETEKEAEVSPAKKVPP